MKTIRDAQTAIGLLERGRLSADLSTELTETLAEMYERSAENPKAKVKGSVTLKLDLVMEDRAVSIGADLTSKRPKPVRTSSFFWVTEEGELSTEHPQQQDMFVRETETA